MQNTSALVPPAAPPTSGGACVHHFFEARAGHAPGGTAVVHGTLALTYGELEEGANRLARHLRRRGAGPEVPVAVCLPRTPELVVALLGILKSGSAYVPLDPAYPRERTARTLRDAGAPLVVTRAELLPLLDASPGAAVLLDAHADEIAAGSATRPTSGVGPENLAYVIYTSGSTGTPKGVRIEHRSAAALLRWCAETFTPEECAGVLGSTSVCFDMSVFEVFHTLGAGGTLVLAENALELPALPARDRVTLVNTVPSAAAALLRAGGVPASVRVVNLGGEPLKNSLAQALYGLSHVDKVYNLYGPTEDTTYSTAARVARGSPREPTVGRAVAGTLVHLLDEELEPVPYGAAGEVFLAGEGLARDYLGRPELTAERFLPAPSGEPGARMYRVGDLGRLLPGGELEYLGRTDHQVKVRGFRVEPGEVEAAMERHPGVREAVVAARRDATGDALLAAYFVAEGEGPAAADLRAFLSERLPEHMLPATYTELGSLPRTPNGKTDRAALPAPGPGAEHVEPRTDTEERLAAIWREVLEIPRVGVRDPFFELGGHSLRAAQVVARVRTVFGVELPVRTLFDVPTVEELATVVERSAAPTAGAEEALEDRLEWLESLSEEEALRLLGEV